MSCLAMIVAGAAVTLSSTARDAAAQETKCYIVACTGNVCVWKEIECPKPTEIKPVTP
jgi:uncharacterized membrane protein